MTKIIFPKHITKVLFDMDGTLVDTELIGPGVFAAYFRSLGVTVELADLTLFTKIWRREVTLYNQNDWLYDYAKMNQINLSKDELLDGFYNSYIEALGQAKPLPGADALLRKLAGRGVDLGLAQQLMHLANQWFGDAPVELEVASYNERAKAFYRKNGFCEMPETEFLLAEKIPSVKMFREGNKTIMNSAIKSSDNFGDSLRIITDQDFDKQAPEFDQKRAWVRRAVRAVLINDQDQICLIHSQKFNYYKLPGGGIQDDETHTEALDRELLEEVGARAEILGKIGQIEERRASNNHMQQFSYAYVAKVIGKIGENHLEQDEKDEQLAPIWVDLDEAIRLMPTGNVETDHGVGQRFMALRDETFLKEYKKIKKNMENEDEI